MSMSSMPSMPSILFSPPAADTGGLDMPSMPSILFSPPPADTGTFSSPGLVNLTKALFSVDLSKVNPLKPIFSTKL